ncbi:MAG: glycosyltransferase family 2 protein [Chloroflexota bacterium]
MKPRISLVIRCYNEERHIGRLLAGVMAQTLADRTEIIVVDSGSTDATLSIARRFPVQVVHISKEEFSFGRSLNQGCAQAQGDFIVIASAHVYPVYRDWLAQLITPFEHDHTGRLALVYGKQRGTITTQYSEHQVFARWFPEESNWQQRHPFCNNANATIRRELWQQFPYDETLTGLEDLDWATRVMAKGYGIAYNAAAEIIHVHNETPHQTFNRYMREGMAYKRIFPHETFRLRDFARLWTGATLSDYRHALLDGALWRSLLSIPRFRFAQYWGTYRGYQRSSERNDDLRRAFYYPNSTRPQSPLPEREALRIDYHNMEEQN